VHGEIHFGIDGFDDAKGSYLATRCNIDGDFDIGALLKGSQLQVNVNPNVVRAGSRIKGTDADFSGRDRYLAGFGEEDVRPGCDYSGWLALISMIKKV